MDSFILSPASRLLSPASHRNRSLVQRRSPREAGFALLITVTLLAFVVILLVGLAAYTRIETAIAGNTQRQAQARENALFALDIALGQLQRYGGPDQRVTATADAFGGAANTRRYTGVWPTDTTLDPDNDPLTPLTWLVSGNEPLNPDGTPVNPLAITPAGATTGFQQLVGPKTVGVGNTAEFVSAPLQPIRSAGVPGTPAAGPPPTIGRYAWWVGDQGVKAPVAVSDTTAAVNYAPYDTAENRSRIRQQIALGAGAADASGNPVFESRDSNNTNLVANHNVSATQQLAFLRNASNTAIGLARVQQNFAAWSPNNYAVLADSLRGGLRDDLSLAPQRLGSAFSAIARYDQPRAVAMEATVQPQPVVGVDPPGPMPPYGTDPLRRRFFITNNQNVVAGGIEGGVHPVLAFFGMSFSIRAPDASAPNYEVAVRCVIGLWNPYSSSLVPPAGAANLLELHVTGLPDVRVQDSLGGDAPVSLQGIMGSPLRFVLAWPDEPTREDEASWLPGRIYYWTAESNTAEPPGGNPMRHNERNVGSVGGQGVVRPAGITHRVGLPGVNVYRQCSVSNGDNTSLRVQLVRPAGSQPGTLATFNSPKFFDFQTAPNQLRTDQSSSDFSFVFRLPDSAEIPTGETATWLSAAARDPRQVNVPSSAYVAGEKGPHPELYVREGSAAAFLTAFPSRLLDRETDKHSFNQDVPVFELPRGPFLSLGALQHLLVPSARPFAIGNPWGAGIEVNGLPANSLFDRFFFSGLVQDLVPSTAANGDLILPNPLLRPMRKADGTKVTIEEIRTMVNPPPTTAEDGTVTPGGPGSSVSSKFFLQGGAFNVNSTSEAAWTAVLRGLRFPAQVPFNYHDVSKDTGTAADGAVATVQSSDAQFFRFSLSAQETYKAEWPDTEADPTATPPRTDLFRQGMRTLTGAQVTGLAAKIVQSIRTKHAAGNGAGGPFRSIEEFLSPSSLFGVADADSSDEVIPPPRSLLEAAIADTGINDAIPEFSSQWLTQADIMTALAPVLFTRSDTFIVRAYGEAVNPITNNTEGRAWCEAVVQRLPEYFNATADDAAVEPASLADLSNLNQIYGRRFKVVSFRWLTRSDI